MDHSRISRDILDLFSKDRSIRRGLEALYQFFEDRGRGDLAAEIARQAATLPDSEKALVALPRLFRSAENSLGVDFLSVLSEEDWRIILAIAGQSAYFTDLCAARSEVLGSLLTDPHRLIAKSARTLLEDLTGDLRDAEAEIEWMTRVRRFRRRELLRIGVRDILGCDDIERICREISDLADVVLGVSTDRVLSEMRDQFGLVRSEDEENEVGFAVIAMGKLGGRELNWSSDVDLLFVYGCEGESEDKRLTSMEYFCRAASRLIRYLTEQTEEGYLYRVDTRLRPQGKAGALALPIEAYEMHYETLGQNWERQALIKARHVAGDPRVGEAFLRMIQPFTYRKSVDAIAVDETLDGIRRMRARYQGPTDEKGEQIRDVKFGRGGIREVEFFVQAVQILYGGQYPEIREPGTFVAIRRMWESGLLTEKDFRDLYGGYSLMRRVEHRIQMEREFHTFKLPQTEDGLRVLGKKLGYSGATDFLAEYDQHARAIAAVYDDVFSDRRTEQGWYDTLLVEPEPGDPGEEYLSRRGFRFPGQSRKVLYDLSWDPENPHLTPKTQRLFRAILPRLLEKLEHSPDPDRAVRNLERILGSYGARSVFFSSLDGNPEALEMFVVLAASSEAFCDRMASHPDLVDFLLRSAGASEWIDPEEMRMELHRTCRAVPEKPLPDHLRAMGQAWDLLLGARFLLRERSLEEIETGLTHRIECSISIIIESVRDALECEMNRPERGDGGASGFAVVGLERLGAREMGFSTPMKLVFIHEDLVESSDKETPSSPFFSRWAGEVQRQLNQEVYPGEVAMPVFQEWIGFSAVSLSFLEMLFETKTSLSDRMSWSRARVIWADEGIGPRIEPLIHSYVYKKGVSRLEFERLCQSVLGLEEQVPNHLLKLEVMKEIGLLVETLLLCHGSGIPGIRTENTLHILRYLTERGILETKAGSILKEGYILVRKAENLIQIMEPRCTSYSPEDSNEKQRCLAVLRHLMGEGNLDSGYWQNEYSRKIETIRTQVKMEIEKLRCHF